MTVVAKQLGFNYTINRAAGTFATPTQIPLIRARNIKRNLDAQVADGSDRNVQFASSLPTRFKLSYDFDGIWDRGAGWLALRAAFTGGNSLLLSALDAQPGNSGLGYYGAFNVTKLNFDFPLIGEQKIDCTIQPAANHTTAQQVAPVTDAGSAGTAETAGTKQLGRNATVSATSGVTMNGIRDFKLGLEWMTADGGDRLSPIEQVLLCQMKVTGELSFIMNRADTQLVAIETAFLAGSPLELYLSDGVQLTTGSWGMHSDWAVTGLPTDAPLVDGQKYTCGLAVHGNAVNLPTFFTT